MGSVGRISSTFVLYFGKGLATPVQECLWKDDVPSIPFFWDESCAPAGGSGCFADGMNLECRFCGEAPYDSVDCPDDAIFPEEMSLHEGDLPEEVAWIVVGGGAAGCSAAAALADAGEDVLVLERGKSDLELKDTQQGATWPAVINSEAGQHIRWEDGVWGVAPNVLGGGSAINGGYSFEETPDYLQHALGRDVDLELLYKSSKYLADNLTHPIRKTAFGEAWAKALHESGHAYNADPKPQLRWQEGSWVALATMNTSKPGVPRRGAAILLHERAHLRNLRVITDALVHKVLFEGFKASGVRVSLKPALRWTSRKVRTVRATKGVIMAAGAIMTPQILQLSGVGPQPLLDKLGVQQVGPDLPVGQNFIDRLVLTLGVKTNRRMPLSIGYAISVNTTLGMTFETEAGGQISSEFAIASLALNKPAMRNEASRMFMKFLFRWPGGKPTPLANDINKMMQVLALQHSAHSRGKIEAQSLDPSVPPRVTANYYSDERDLMAQRLAVKELLKVAGTEALKDYVAGKVQVPFSDDALADGLKCMSLGPSYRGHNSQDPTFKVMPCLPSEPASTKEWHDYLRKNVVSSYHYFGTAAVGSVLETGDLRVKGFQGLHVVDASVFPDPPRVNPQHLIMTVGHYIGTLLAKRSQGMSQLETRAGVSIVEHANASSAVAPEAEKGQSRRRRRSLPRGFAGADALLAPGAATV